MALQVIYNAAILINSVDLSGKAKKARVSFGTEKKDATAFGNVTRGYVVGLGTQMVEQGVQVAALHFPLGHALGQRALDALDAFGDGLCTDVVQRDLEARGGESLRDAGAHVAGADDGDVSDGHCAAHCVGCERLADLADP